MALVGLAWFRAKFSGRIMKMAVQRYVPGKVDIFINSVNNSV
jgi:hypothetical protein